MFATVRPRVSPPAWPASASSLRAFAGSYLSIPVRSSYQGSSGGTELPIRVPPPSILISPSLSMPCRIACRTRASDSGAREWLNPRVILSLLVPVETAKFGLPW